MLVSPATPSNHNWGWQAFEAYSETTHRKVRRSVCPFPTILDGSPNRPELETVNTAFDIGR